jgi:hypothetical protein
MTEMNDMTEDKGLYVPVSDDELEARARKILTGEWERPDDIAWALVNLTSKDKEHGENRYRRIAGAREWIDSLGLPTGEADGQWYKQPSGTRVSGLGGDVRDRTRVRVATVRDAAIAAGRKWPDVTEPTAEVAQTAEPTTANALTNEGDDAKRLNMGRNSKASINAYIERRSREIYAAKEASTREAIAKILEKEMRANGYFNASNKPLSAGRIDRLMPAGFTGGKEKNGRKK